MIKDSARISTLFIQGKVKAGGIIENVRPVYGQTTLKKIYVAFTDIHKRIYYRISKKAYLEALNRYAVNTRKRPDLWKIYRSEEVRNFI